MKGSCSWKFWSIEGLLKQKIPCKIYPATMKVFYSMKDVQVDKIDRIKERLGNLCSRLSKETKTTTAICNRDKLAGEISYE